MEGGTCGTEGVKQGSREAGREGRRERETEGGNPHHLDCVTDSTLCKQEVLSVTECGRPYQNLIVLLLSRTFLLEVY
jgi:hypothetical protein